MNLNSFIAHKLQAFNYQSQALHKKYELPDFASSNKKYRTVLNPLERKGREGDIHLGKASATLMLCKWFQEAVGNFNITTWFKLKSKEIYQATALLKPTMSAGFISYPELGREDIETVSLTWSFIQQSPQSAKLGAINIIWLPPSYLNLDRMNGI